MRLVSTYVRIYPQALPVKKIETTETTDGEAVSKGKGKENKTNWDGIELGQTKDWRYTFQLCYQLILVTCTQTMDQFMECEWNQSVDKGIVSSVLTNRILYTVYRMVVWSTLHENTQTYFVYKKPSVLRKSFLW